MWWPPRMTKNEPITCSSTAVTYGSHDTTASTLPSLRAGARPNCDQMFSMVRSSYFMPARRNTILKYSSDVCPRASPIRLSLRSATLPALMPVPLRVTIPSGSSALSRVASFIMMPITLNGSPEWTAFRKVVTLMSPICAFAVVHRVDHIGAGIDHLHVGIDAVILEDALLGTDEHRQMAEIIADHDIQSGQLP